MRECQAIRGLSISRLVALAVMGIAVVALPACSISKSHKKAIQVARYRGGQLDGLNGRMGQLEGQLADAHRNQELTASRERELRDQLALADAGADANAQDVANMRSELVRLQTDLAQARQVVADLGAEFDSLQSQNRDLRDRLVNTPPTPPVVDSLPDLRTGPSPQALAMQRDLQDRLGRYGLRGLPVEIRNDGYGERVAIVLPDAFKSGQAELFENKEAVQAIVGLGRLINEQYPSAQVLVEGHTDADPLVRTKAKWGTNERLSQARAETVRELLTQSGLAGSQVSTAGFGAQRLLDSGGDKSSKSRNRRVEIYIAPNA
ncbi:MAG: OmpA family protein [Planctomycetes bacterium]|nr:OmpA family protein [Planctomycetota bacterium]MCB9826279.1 OmpA family protein [Planctomycetota bacterium]MCB9830690.1 OmpA family protein [Planctomycetota bacterium]MCB9901850.1 OmpA family protein [Planctomycetota bacterium]